MPYVFTGKVIKFCMPFAYASLLTLPAAVPPRDANSNGGVAGGTAAAIMRTAKAHKVLTSVKVL